MKITYGPLIFALGSLLLSCNQSGKKGGASEIQKSGIIKQFWGNIGNDSVFLYTLKNNGGTEIKISNYGGTITRFITKDKTGKVTGIVVGLDSLSDYLKNPPYFGALIGRYANRIGNASFTLDGKKYNLFANDGKNTLHGGKKGFDKVIWTPSIQNDSIPQLTLNYLSRDGEEGFPGNLSVTVTYTLNDSNELKIEYKAQTDKPTPINLTNHAYFNLSGNLENSILNHSLQINADNYTPVDSTLIPTGVIAPVKGTPYDFTQKKKIDQDFDKVKGGYDFNWVLNGEEGTLRKVAELSDSISGRTLEVYTTQPGLQFYTGNFLDGTFINYDGKPITLHSALCLETQHFPNSPNQPNFPSTILQPGKEFHSETIYKVIINQN